MDKSLHPFDTQPTTVPHEGMSSRRDEPGAVTTGRWGRSLAVPRMPGDSLGVWVGPGVGIAPVVRCHTRE